MAGLVAYGAESPEERFVRGRQQRGPGSFRTSRMVVAGMGAFLETSLPQPRSLKDLDTLRQAFWHEPEI
jgi:hypothetical protein